MELSALKGVTEKRLEDLLKLGIDSVEGLIKHYPRNYLDLTKQVKLSECYNNDIVLTCATVVGMPQMIYAGRHMRYVKAYVEQEGQCFEIVWFNQPYVIKQLASGVEYLFYGRVRNRYGSQSLTNPSFEPVERNINLKGIVPVYSIKGIITQRIMRTLIANALYAVKLNSVIPQKFIDKYHISPLNDAYREVHNPQSVAAKNMASERIALEEYFVLISAFKFIKGSREQVRLNHYECSSRELVEFTQKFPFDFTEGQKSAVNEIYADLTGGTVMNRLLQGDVGCGKTAVSMCAVFMAYQSGYQTALISPTEVLARQNYEVCLRYFPLESAAFLSGSTPAAEKRAIKAKIKSGEARIVVGTHAVLTADVEFAKLALCVCDEQQRFGVAQRSALVDKGDVPDVLAMSATPIPRTLSLIFYGDLDISTIPDKPKLRATIGTNIVPDGKYADMLKFIGREVARGRQAYFICPLIDGDEEGSIMSATELYDSLREAMPNVSFALLHGKIKDKEKNEVMRKFKNNEVSCLVSTTVIEVGVDVPNATVMVIYNAERFGLSQLHQLRGRVGRGEEQSYCFLLCGTENQTSIERLNVLKKNSDGFKISESDFEARGSGDFLGTRQSGRFFSELGALQFPTSIIFFAKKLSDEVFVSGEQLDALKQLAFDKYDKLKDVTLN